MYSRDDKISVTRLTAVQYAALAICLVLGYGLWRLQVAGSARYEMLAEQNRVRSIPILAPRGKILDRDGNIIVENYPSVSALLLRDQVKDIEPHIGAIASGLGMTPEEVRERLRRFAYAPAYEPIVLKDDITPDEHAFIEAHRNELPELETIMVHRRLYPKNGFAAHMIGYVGEVSEQMLNNPRYELYYQGDIVGTSGLEAQYNDLLMGKNGLRRVLVNSRGKEVGRLSTTPADPGKPLKTSIDLDVQIAAEEALEGHNGAIVALDPRTGEVLAMASRPVFDPNQFAVRISRAEWNRLITDEQKPLLNKAIQAQLAPGSVFKIIMAVAATNEGMGEMQVSCGGGKNFYGRHFKCWVVAEHRTHGVVELSKAIYQSCDTFFYTLGERLGIGRIARYAEAFGLGRRTQIDLPQEASGLVPSEEWKIRNYKQKWYAGETISVSIGQGAVSTTPLQLAVAIGAIASGGVMHQPHIAVQDALPEQFRLASFNAAGTRPVPIAAPAWELITDAMAEVVNPGGTAPSAHLQGIDFAGKTGSAQVVSNTARAKLSGHQFKDNGWFVGVAPRRNPEIVVSVLIEQGEHGYLAARIAAQVIKTYVEKNRRKTDSGVAKSAQGKAPRKIEMAAVWNEPPAHTSGATPDPQAAAAAEPQVRGGRFQVEVAARPEKKRATAPLQSAGGGR